MIKKQKTFKEDYINELNNECNSTNNNTHNSTSREAKSMNKESEPLLRSSSTKSLFDSYKTIMTKGKVSNNLLSSNNKMFQSSLCGTKKINQDSCVALPNHFNLDQYDIMAIFDGHGQNGHFISQLAKSVFIHFFSRSDLFYIPRQFKSSPNLLSLKNLIKEEDIYQKISQQNYRILRDGFTLIEAEINSSEYEKDFSGSTGCAVFVVGRHAICVNIGDSRAIIISNKGKTVSTLSIDHKPQNKKEKERIIKCGGEVRKSNEKVLSNSTPYRVWVKDRDYPGLAMSRSLGDFIAKEIGVIDEPDICDHPLSKEDMYIVVASDGVWEWLSNEDVEKTVTPFYLANNIEKATESLISQARKHFIDSGEYIDDITVTILFLNK